MKLNYRFAHRISLLLVGGLLLGDTVKSQDKEADNMLVYQRAIGGWPKHINEVKVDYKKALTEEEKQKIKADSLRKDATIDNNATIKEIRHLAVAFKTTGNKAYLKAAEKGLSYLLKAQNNAGGWPQFYPDSSSYRAQITYNDNAMANVLNLLMDVKQGKKDMDVVDASFKPKVFAAIDKGVQCILATQIKQDGKLTGWCAQHDRKTLKPVNARKFELASISGMETVGIVRFLMRVENPTPEIKTAVAGAIDWLNKSKIAGYRYDDVQNASQPKGFDRVLVPDTSSVLWARFYDLDTNKPFFTGRDGVKKFDVKEIEYERRVGYAWYGVWPQKLIEVEYPKWLKSNL